MRGRPSTYDSDIAAQICEKLSEGETLADICRKDGMPSESTVRSWALDDREGFFAPYSRARELQMDAFADQMIDIADNPSGDHNRDRLRLDARKWLTSKIAAKRYGDRVVSEHVGKDGGAIETRGDMSEVAKLLLTKLSG